MKKLKKFELLERAMRDYPAGTIARFKSAPKVDHISDGIFQILDINQDGSTNIFSGSGLNRFYSSHDEDGEFKGEWAIPIDIQKEHPSITEDNNLGKKDKVYDMPKNCAIRVNSGLEFKLLMKYYDSKGWVSQYGDKLPDCIPEFSYPVNIEYCNYPNQVIIDNYSIIEFKHFAKQMGIKMPLFIIKSEDGVDLFSGMEMWGAKYMPGIKKWIIGSFKGDPFVLTDDTINLNDNEDFPYITQPSKWKAFSTKEAAEKWIAEQNEPKPPMYVFTSKDGVRVHEGEYVQCVAKIDGVWELADGLSVAKKFFIENKRPYETAYFSNESNAENWVKEQNKAKSIVLKREGAEVTVSIDKIDIRLDNGNYYWFETTDLEAICKAYQSLNKK